MAILNSKVKQASAYLNAEGAKVFAEDAKHVLILYFKRPYSTLRRKLCALCGALCELCVSIKARRYG